MKHETYTVRVIRPMDWTAKMVAEKKARGQRIPLSARIGRGPMFVIPTEEETRKC